jgi:adenylate kinase family enzyme
MIKSLKKISIGLAVFQISTIAFLPAKSIAGDSTRIETKQSIVDRGFVLPSGNIYCLMIRVFQVNKDPNIWSKSPTD